MVTNGKVLDEAMLADSVSNLIDRRLTECNNHKFGDKVSFYVQTQKYGLVRIWIDLPETAITE